MKTYCLVCRKLTGNAYSKTVKKQTKTNDEVNLSSLCK